MNLDALIASLPHRTRNEIEQFRINAERRILKGTPEQKEEASRLLAALPTAPRAPPAGRRSRAKSAPSGVDSNGGVTPPPETHLSTLSLGDRVELCFRDWPPTDHQHRIIQVLLDNAGSSSTSLTALLGYADNKVWQMHFGNMCKDRSAWLGSPEIEADGRPFWSGLMADYDKTTRGYTIKVDAAVGLDRLGIRHAEKA